MRVEVLQTAASTETGGEIDAFRVLDLGFSKYLNNNNSLYG
jgi:hypothetical protein